MLIILEGSDKCGKTTLARFLAVKFQADYVKFSAPVKPAYDEYRDFLFTIDPRKNYVLDRFLYGELVYGPIYRGKSGVTPEQMRFLETIMARVRTAVIYCETDLQQIRDNFVKDDEQFTRQEDIEEILKRYKYLWSQTHIKPYYFNYLTDPTYGRLMPWLRAELNDKGVLK